MNLDLYLIELDVNNDPVFETMPQDDTLMRSLLQLPQQPAVVRIRLRGFTLPHVIHNRTAAKEAFGIERGINQTDYRHISALSHNVLGDMVSLFVRMEVCEARRRESLDALALPREDDPWLTAAELGQVPQQILWDPVRTRPGRASFWA
ncbi:hypothetical protein BMF94_3755 [Rhodotorula taiwanensis]|uniref:Uncharacterized protein n=1 Tax=Rhodotorula taiwanensis TaxID=741276 RepID=A0A2S5B9H0_9BASI|nr:hypothetical protein BMF94_3755 [Rhodotorula taiwanensis]